MKFRRFTPAGIAAARDYLAKAKADAALDLPARDALIASPALTESIPALADLDFDPTRTFDTTFAFCEYLDSLLATRNPQSYREDVGFWTYLAFAYLEQLVGDARGTTRIGAVPRLVYEASSHMTGHRHLLCHAYYLYNTYRQQSEICKVVLWHHPSVYNDLVEQLLSRQYIVQNPAFLRTANDLYFDKVRQRTKRGAAGVGGGCVRRFVEIVDQLSMTRDFYAVEDSVQCERVLPHEFDRFKVL